MSNNTFYIKKIPSCILTVMGFLFLFVFASALHAADAATIPLMVSKAAANEVTYSLSIKILVVMALLTVIPALLITMTAFTRIIIVLSIVRQALGIQNVPSNQILIGLSLIMTVYVMMPVFDKMHETSIKPYLAGQQTEEQALASGAVLIKQFMLKQTRQTDVLMFTKLAKIQVVNQDYPLYVLMPAFITSELKTAFQIGFLIFLPFLIIDLVTASVLMSMGMMMLSPMVISLPFKLLFFVLVNGWQLMVTSLISSFR